MSTIEDLPELKKADQIAVNVMFMLYFITKEAPGKKLNYSEIARQLGISRSTLVRTIARLDQMKMFSICANNTARK